MTDRRINIPKEHVQLVDSLLESKENEKNGPFKTKAAVIAYAAALGACEGDPLPFTENGGDPIRRSVFSSAGYDPLINLLSVAHENNPNILAETEGMEDRRATIFEGYANRGLGIIRERIARGADDFLDVVLMELLKKRPKANSGTPSLDISDLIG